MEESDECGSGLGAAPWAGAPYFPSAASPSHATSLRVTEVQRDSVTLSWTPVPGASEYVLSWTPPAGEADTCPWAEGSYPQGFHCPCPPDCGYSGRRGTARGAGHCQLPTDPWAAPGPALHLHHPPASGEHTWC